MTPSAASRRLAFLPLLIALVVTGSAVAAPKKLDQVHVSCAGDTLSGWVKLNARGTVTLRLLAKRSSQAAFAATGRTASVSGDAGEYPFSFDVSRIGAFAYRVDGGDSPGRVVPATSCAPGHQIPEAPLALLLPLSVLGLVAAGAARRRAADQ